MTQQRQFSKEQIQFLDALSSQLETSLTVAFPQLGKGKIADCAKGAAVDTLQFQQLSQAILTQPNKAGYWGLQVFKFSALVSVEDERTLLEETIVPRNFEACNRKDQLGWLRIFSVINTPLTLAISYLFGYRYHVIVWDAERYKTEMEKRELATQAARS